MNLNGSLIMMQTVRSPVLLPERDLLLTKSFLISYVPRKGHRDAQGYFSSQN